MRLTVVLSLSQGLFHSHAGAADEKPIRVGFSIAQTGPLSGEGKTGLLALEMWRDEINAAGGLLERQVELVEFAGWR